LPTSLFFAPKSPGLCPSIFIILHILISLELFTSLSPKRANAEMIRVFLDVFLQFFGIAFVPLNPK
jgi:hypothetical protein